MRIIRYDQAPTFMNQIEKRPTITRRSPIPALLLTLRWHQNLNAKLAKALLPGSKILIRLSRLQQYDALT